MFRRGINLEQVAALRRLRPLSAASDIELARLDSLSTGLDVAAEAFLTTVCGIQPGGMTSFLALVSTGQN